LHLLRYCKVLFQQSLRAIVSSNSLEIFGSGCFGFSTYLIFSKKGTIHVYDRILSCITMYHPHFVSFNQILANDSNSFFISSSWTLIKIIHFIVKEYLSSCKKDSVAKTFLRLNENTTWKATLYFNKISLLRTTIFFVHGYMCLSLHPKCLFSSYNYLFLLVCKYAKSWACSVVKSHVASVLVWRNVYQVVARY
jgi:hypothetical protein